MEILFSQYKLHDLFQQDLAIINQKVKAISKNQFLASTNDQLIDHLYSELAFIPITLYENQMTRSEPKEINLPAFFNALDQEITIPSFQMEFMIPFKGDSVIWKAEPSSSFVPKPKGRISEDIDKKSWQLFIEIAFSSSSGETGVSTKITNELESIKRMLVASQTDIEKHNNNLRNVITQNVISRRGQLENLERVVKALNIPLHKRNDAPDLNQVPLQRKVIQPLPTVPNKSPEYTISNENYEYILKVIRHEGRSYERTPKTFSMHNEEELRDILVAHLNGHYEGLANGEAFRHKGKTDICIEFENRAAFVAECKIWGGEKLLHKTIEQLLGYLTWRDCKQL